MVLSNDMLCSQDMASEASTLLCTGKRTLRLASVCGPGLGDFGVPSTIGELTHAHLLLLAPGRNSQGCSGSPPVPSSWPATEKKDFMMDVGCTLKAPEAL